MIDKNTIGNKCSSFGGYIKFCEEWTAICEGIKKNAKKYGVKLENIILVPPLESNDEDY